MRPQLSSTNLVVNRPVQRPSWRQIIPWKWQPFVLAVAVITAAAALRRWSLQAVASRTAWLTFYPAVMVAATYGGLAAGLLATALACLTVTFLWPMLVAQPFIKDGADWSRSRTRFRTTCARRSGTSKATSSCSSGPARASSRRRPSVVLIDHPNLVLIP